MKLLAEHGFDSFGVEIAEKAVEIARECYKSLREGGSGKGEGKIEFVLGDYFKDDWVKREIVGEEGQTEGAVDLIYDYTVRLPINPPL